MEKKKNPVSSAKMFLALVGILLNEAGRES